MPVIIRSNQTRKKGVSAIASNKKSVEIASNRINEILDIMDAAYKVPYMMASGGTVGRGSIGPGYDIVREKRVSSARDADKRRIQEFFLYSDPNLKNYRDIFGPLAKLYTTAFMFRMFGTAAWEIRRDKSGGAVGFDIVPGIIRPNVDDFGYFQKPAYTQYLKSGNSVKKIDIMDQKNIVFFGIPDFGPNLFLSETMALSSYTLPSEIYAARAYLSLHENRTTPYGGFWWLPENATDETYDDFFALLNSMYRGSENYGKSPLLMRGKGGFEYITPPKDDAPYAGGREINRKEISGVTGVPGAKYGVDVEGVGQGGMKEIRREFYESVLRPVSSLMEEFIYIQICIREFNAPGWRFMLNRPDFTTALEDASIEMRRIQWGTQSPNEARIARGEEPRDDGDYYLIPLNMTRSDMAGRPESTDVTGSEGDLPPSEETPVTGQEPPETPDKRDVISELYAWKRFHTRMISGDRYARPFNVEKIPEEFANYLSAELLNAGADKARISEIFEDARDILEEYYG